MVRLTTFIMISAIGLTACGGGGGGSPAPSITLSPINDATAVEPDISVTASFSFDVLGTSVTDTNFTLSDGNSVAGTVSFDGTTNIATLAPGSKLALLKEHTATLTTGITKLNGDPINETQWSFTTRDGSWSSEEKLENLDTSTTTENSISFDDDGNAIAIWYTSPNVYASYYTAETGIWSAPEQIDLNGGVDLTTGASHTMVRMNSEGNAIAVWSHNDGGIQQIYANHFDKTTGWSDTARKIDAANAGEESKPEVAFDDSGDAIVIWFNEGEDSVRVAHYDSTGDSWGNAVLLENSANPLITPSLTPPRIAVTGSGDAVAVWTQSNGIEDVVYASEYNNLGDTWSAPSEISDANDAALDATVAIDSSGNAIAIWEQSADGRDSIFVNRFDGVNWGTAELIESDDINSASQPEISFGGYGNAIAIWIQNGVVTRRYVAGTGWEAAESFGKLSNETVWRPRVVIDAEGNAVAFWRESVNDPNDIITDEYVVVNRYVVSTGTWSGNVSLVTKPDMGIHTSVAMNSSGYAGGLWLRKDAGETNQSLWARIFE